MSPTAHLLGALVGALMLAGSGGLVAQTSRPILAGISVAGEGGLASGKIPLYAGSPFCGEFDGGVASGFSLGVVLFAPDLVAPGFGGLARAGWTRAAESFVTQPLDPQSIFDRRRGELVYLEREYRLAISHDLLRADLLASFRAAPSLFFLLGPSVGVRTMLGFEQSDRLVDPGEISFADGSTEQPFAGGRSFTPRFLDLEVVAGASWQIPLGEHYMILPEISARVGATAVAEESIWRRTTIGAGLSVLYDLTSNVPVPLPPESIPVLDVSIDLYSVDRDGRRSDSTVITVSEILHRHYTPFLPVIFFEKDAATPAARYESGPGAGDSLSTTVEHADAIALHHRLLDIVARRMQRDSSASLTLFGRHSRNESPSLASRRIDAVRTYLNSAWGIEKNRLRTTREAVLPSSNEATEEGSAENRRVELGSEERSLLAPVVSERVSRRFDPPTVGMAPDIRAEAGVKSWEIIIRHGDRIVTRYSSDDSGSSAMAWDLVAERLDTTALPLVAELTVVDSTGGIATASDEIPLALVRSQMPPTTTSGDRTVIEREVSGFGYGAAEPESRIREEIGAISREIGSGARITVTGYADRLGELTINRNLSMMRASAVTVLLKEALKDADERGITIRAAAGESGAERFDNDLPEGRMFSRGAVIVIEQDVR